MEYYDWYFSWKDLKRYLARHFEGKKQDILHIGCGNSPLGELLWELGYGTTTNMDYCPIIIEAMEKDFKSRYVHQPPDDVSLDDCRFITMDVNTMAFADAMFDVVLEKGVIDAFACGEDRFDLGASECCRVLKPGGIFISITWGNPKSRLSLFHLEALPWKLESHSTLTSLTNQIQLYHIYVLRKHAIPSQHNV
eukprot:TRINITY_DN16308_c0_g1_i1.p1 TRINITY_DN16308_c0_g1~~TRINITY_DN16308_c0_g1_i1.p1  ORF type:complete len:223 (-),score=47.15 TRINITY_DN16308_c0_g1_i1:14-595(-)